MSVFDLLLIAFGLAMDAFAVSVCKGMTMPRRDWKKTVIIALWFSVFQMGMPLIGYLAGEQFSGVAGNLAPWIAFALLALIGGNMIREAFGSEDGGMNDDVSPKTMLPLAVATSIDALATGVTFAFAQVRLALGIALIGGITFLMCAAGVLLGRAAGEKLGKRASITGGIVLILIGVKYLVEHLVGG